ncbi:hypothetical protein ISN44_As10g002410 [Arabidopsis suecica]|uniref:Uncharacterized protein n=1 Tax=Arabidopsis suecica TaxID=45249 RepID=A0A8T1ZV57_ARASU|nr:hypothetical protein ISN44_As10g002410 [Arabidopsis suecica]
MLLNGGCAPNRPRFVASSSNLPNSYILGGEDAIDKALKLSGCDVDGWNIVVDYVFPPPGFPRKRHTRPYS